MKDLELAALLCSRLCHDLISPIGAVNNGIEVMMEGGGEDMQAQALELVTYSAGEASASSRFMALPSRNTGILQFTKSIGSPAQTSECIFND